MAIRAPRIKRTTRILLLLGAAAAAAAGGRLYIFRVFVLLSFSGCRQINRRIVDDANIPAAAATGYISRIFFVSGLTPEFKVVGRAARPGNRRGFRVFVWSAG